jgi:hypothetical protein
VEVMRYFFDLWDGSDNYRDDSDGTELDDLEMAKIEAAQGLMEIAKSWTTGCSNRLFIMLIRDENGPTPVRLTLALTLEDASLSEFAIDFPTTH